MLLIIEMVLLHYIFCWYCDSLGSTSGDQFFSRKLLDTDSGREF